MRLWIAFLLLTTAAALAQHRGGFSGGFGRGGGFGRPGVVGGGMRFGHIGIGPRFGHGGFRPGFRGGFFAGGFGGGGYGRGGFIRSGFSGSGFGFHSGFGASSFYSGFPVYAPGVSFAPILTADWYSVPPPPVVLIIQEQRDDAPISGGAMIINNTPVIPWRQQDYRVERDRSNDAGPIVYLIALKDGEIWAAVAYWVDGSILHLVTRRNEQMTFPLDEVDRSFSERLNRERRVQFRLP